MSSLLSIPWDGWEGSLPSRTPPPQQLKERTRIEIERERGGRERVGDGREINRERQGFIWQQNFGLEVRQMSGRT